MPYHGCNDEKSDRDKGQPHGEQNVFGTGPSYKEQQQAACSQQQCCRKIGRGNKGTDNKHRGDHGQITLFERFDNILLPAKHPRDIHEKCELGQVGCLHGHVDERQPYPAAAFIHPDSEEKGIDQ